MKVVTTLRPGLLVIIVLLGACTHQKYTPASPAPASTEVVSQTPREYGEEKSEAQTTASTETDTISAGTQPDKPDGTANKPEANKEKTVTIKASENRAPAVSANIPARTPPSAPAIEKPAETPREPKTRVESMPAPSVAIPKIGELGGKVKIIGKRNKVHRPTNVIVTLTPLNPASYHAMRQNLRTHDVDMKNKTYLPIVQTIRRGDKLQFNNNDNIKHNVFSSSGENTFDLGTFKGGGVRSVAMEHNGIVKVYCNIHPEMASFVMVSDYPYHAISGQDGSFQIDDIPAGKYELALWHIRGELKKTIEINEGHNHLDNLVIDASNYQRVAHKNKYGKDYKKKPALFEDEFY